ncbi:MAG: cyclophilin-like fold protein [Tessaracoccus sp.]
MAINQSVRKAGWAVLGIVLIFGVSACSGDPAENRSSSAPFSDQAIVTVSPSPSITSAAPSSPTPSPAEESEQSIAGTVVHFSAGDVVVEVLIEEDNPTTRSFLAMLPMTLTFSDYGGKEKVASPAGEFDYTDAEGLNPVAGDLFSYTPWGNIGFFYTSEGNSFSNSLTKIGSTDDIDQILLLDGQEVTINLAE